MELYKAEKMARDLMAQHLDGTWRFAFDNAKRRFGVCKYRDRTIGLSRALTALNGEDEVRDVILHEIAHALAGHGAGHGYAWQAKCREVGARPERCYDSSEVATPEGAYQGTCPSCGKVVQRHRKTARMFSTACAKCCKTLNGGQYSANHAFVWRHHGRVITR